MFQRKSIIVFALCTILSVSAVYETASAEKDCGDAVICTLTGKFKSLETLEILPPDPKWIFSMVDGNTEDPAFRYINARVRVTAPGVTATSGYLYAYAMYKKRSDDFDINLSKDPPTEDDRQAQYTISTSYPYPVSNLTTTAQGFVFNFMNSPIPVGITDLYFGVFYRGTGSGGTFLPLYGTLDLNEPMHYVTFNSTDYVCCDGVLLSPQEYRDQDLWSSCPLIDIDPVTDLMAGLAFFENPAAPPQYYDAIAYNMPVPSYSRLILLLKGNETAVIQSLYSARLGHSTSPYDSDAFSAAGVVNQEQAGGGFQSTLVHEFRGIRYHSDDGAVFHNCTAEQLNGLPWPTLSDSNKTPISIWED